MDLDISASETAGTAPLGSQALLGTVPSQRGARLVPAALRGEALTLTGRILSLFPTARGPSTPGTPTATSSGSRLTPPKGRRHHLGPRGTTAALERVPPAGHAPHSPAHPHAHLPAPPVTPSALQMKTPKLRGRAACPKPRGSRQNREPNPSWCGPEVRIPALPGGHRDRPISGQLRRT